MGTLVRTVSVILVVALGAWAPPLASADEARVPIVGLLPAYDASGEGHGSVVAQALEPFLFHRLGESPLRVVLLNPGSGYAPHDEESFLELARDEGIGHLVLTTVESSTRPQKNKVELHATATVLDVGTRRRLGKALAAAELKRDDAQHYREFEGVALFARSRHFQKEPLGKATDRLAATLAEGLSGVWGTLPAAAPLAAAGGPGCSVRFRIRYPGEAVSKTYSVEVNGHDETLGVRDGAVPLTMSSGPVVVHAIVQDAPPRLPIQPTYFANAILDCAARPRELVLQIGTVGEGRLAWQ